MIISSEDLVDEVDAEGSMINHILFSNTIENERETVIGPNEKESVENNNTESPLDWSKYRPTMLRTKKKSTFEDSKGI